MRIGIVGAGFAGLAAAAKLAEKGNEIVIFEQSSHPGGLATGFKKPEWDWTLEEHYHHIFTSDTCIQDFAKQFDVSFDFSRPITSSLLENGIIVQLDSPLKLLMCKEMSLIDRLRTGIVLGYLRYVASWQSLEGFTAHAWLSRWLGKKNYSRFWEPLLKAKFGNYYKDISLAWFWARIKARTTQLGYPEGGFQQCINHIASQINSLKNVQIQYSSSVHRVERSRKGVEIDVVSDDKKHTHVFDQVLLTAPNAIVAKMVHGLPDSYVTQLRSFKSIGAINLILELDTDFLSNNTYWLNICDTSYPFLAVVEHTHFIPRSHYGGSHIVYVGNYLPADHRYFSLSAKELLKEYDPYLQKLHAKYDAHIKDITICKTPFAQPIVFPDFSHSILSHKTPVEGVFLANMQQVYPWDRGTNFAVEIGQEVARVMQNA